MFSAYVRPIVLINKIPGERREGLRVLVLYLWITSVMLLTCGGGFVFDWNKMKVDRAAR